MRVARSFSTILWRSKQALYEPYVAPLNEEQKKALRKLMAKNLPKYNGHLNKDIQRLLHAFQPPQLTFRRRKQTIEHIEQIIKAAYGPEYSVIDRSLYKYSRDVSCAPLELALHDDSRPNGFPPGTELEFLPDPYNHEALAKLFQGHGYTGCFVAGDTTRTVASDEQQARRHYQIGDKGDPPVNPPWTSFTPRPVPHLTYPLVLYAEQTDETMPFFLSPPMPTHLPLVRLLDAYFSLNTSYSDLLALVFLWIRSIDLSQLTPTCIALMVIGFLQVRKLLPSLQNPPNIEDIENLAKNDEGVWVQAEWRPRYPPKAFWVETGFILKPTPEQSLTAEQSSLTEAKPRRLPSMWPKKMGPLLFDFFKFWSQEHTSRVFICSESALSVREGTITRRAPLSKEWGSPLHRDQTNRDMIHEGVVPWSPTSEPIIWQAHPIVIPDPFISSYNHAQSLSKPAGNYFHYFNSLSHRTLSHGHPLATILGPHLPIPNGVIRRSIPSSHREYSTCNLGHQVKELYESMIPPPEVFSAREKTISRVQKVIRYKYGDYKVQSFGSTQYGVSSASSDLDLVITDPRFSTGFSPQVRVSRLPAVYNVNHVGRVLSSNGFTQVFTIPKATVPIVKFRDPTTGLECDLNTNDQLGIWNTRLIRTYCDLSADRVRPLIMIIKRWAKSHGFNDPSGGAGPVTFSSYALVLMVIGFLQAKGVLPNLQAGLQELPQTAKQGVFWVRRRKQDSMRCDIRFSDGVDWTPVTHMELDDALKNWFTFWASEFDYSSDILSIRAGGLVKRAAKHIPPKEKQKKKNKAQKTEALSLLEQQESVRELEEENAIAAWRSQNEDEEDVERERATQVEETPEGATESQSSSEDEDGELGVAVDEEVAVGATSGSQNKNCAHRDLRREEIMEKRFTEEHSERGVASECLSCDGSRSQVQAHPAGSQPSQPPQWQSQTLIVVDPFILDKNVCGLIVKNNIERFKEECQRSVLTLTCGGDLADLMGDGNPLPGALDRRGKRGKRGKRG